MSKETGGDIAKNEVGPDGKVQVWDLHDGKYKRVYPIDANEQFRAGTAARRAPDTVMVKGDEARSVEADEVNQMVKRGWRRATEEEAAAHLAAHADAPPKTAGKIGGDGGGGEGEGGAKVTGDADVEKQRMEAAMSMSLKELREVGQKHGVPGVETLNKSQIATMLVKTSWAPAKE